MCLPGPLAKSNSEIDQLLIVNVLTASEFNKKHHLKEQRLKRGFF